MKNKSGFTLVELLIVIVVISILASISVVAYNGIQNRAYSTAANVARNNFVKLLQVYKVNTGAYPVYTGAGSTSVCIGDSSNYKAADGFAANQCSYSTYSGITTSVNASVNSALSAYGNMPSINWPYATETHSGFGTDYYRGMFYSAYATGEKAHVWYFLRGEATCPVEGYGAYDPYTGETQCTVLIE